MLTKLRILAVLLMLCAFSNKSQATHFLGYDMELVNIKDANNNPTNTYKWRLKFYRDKAGIPIPSSFTFNLYRVSDNAPSGTFTVTKVNPYTIINYSPELCVASQSLNKVEVGIYESQAQNYATLNSPSGYYATENHCCRNTGIANTQTPSAGLSVLFFAQFPGVSSGLTTQYNSSPYFNTYPIYGFSVGKLYTIDWSATDPDGDSLVYTIVPGREGGPTAPNFSDIQLYFGYSLNGNLADGNPDFNINPSTGMAIYKPTVASRYLVAVKVEEYRKIAGVPTKIGEIRREMQIEAFISDEKPPVLYDSLANTTVYDTILAITPQSKVLNFTSVDHPDDSVFIKIIPVVSATSNNILDTNIIDVRWSDILGNTVKGSAAESFIIKGKIIAKAFLTINADSNSVSNIPYKFKIISYDQTCITPLTDTVNYELLVRGAVCYNSVQSIISACDSFNYQGTMFYQTTTVTDTTKSTVGCDVINTTNIIIGTSPQKPIIAGNFNITDTSQFYTYTVDSQANVIYQWGGIDINNTSFISGINTATLTVKWKVANAQETIDCYVYRDNCFDSTYVNINVNHAVGINSIQHLNLIPFPNPVNDVLMFNSTKNLDRALISIYNTLGQKIAETVINNNYADVSKLPHGAYIFTVMHNDIMYRGKFLKLAH